MYIYIYFIQIYIYIYIYIIYICIYPQMNEKTFAKVNRRQIILHFYSLELR